MVFVDAVFFSFSLYLWANKMGQVTFAFLRRVAKELRENLSDEELQEMIMSMHSGQFSLVSNFHLESFLYRS